MKKKRKPVTVFRNPLARLQAMPKEVRDRFTTRAHLALAEITTGSSNAAVEAWRDLADVVNVTEVLAAHLRMLDIRALEYTRQANESMRASQERYKQGMSLRLDAKGIEAVREVINIYEQCLTLLTERQVEHAFQATADKVHELIKSGVEAVAL